MDQAKIHELASSIKPGDRRKAIELLSSAFPYLPDKTEAWKDLIRLTNDDNYNLRFDAAYGLISVSYHVPDKNIAWQDIMELIQEGNRGVEDIATTALRHIFPYVLNKKLAWKDLIRLTEHPNNYVQYRAMEVLELAFAHVLDETMAWQDLIKLTQHEDTVIQFNAADFLQSAFLHVTNKNLAWKDLVGLAQDENNLVKWRASDALGSAYSYVTDKSMAWEDLTLLTQDEDSRVRMYAHYSMGKASVFKATMSEDIETLRTELEAAVEFLERSSQETTFFNPARFCLPFYRSYISITFHGATDAEVQRYLTEAKEAVGSSESRRVLLEAVENLARALQESQRLKKRSIDEISSELTAYRWYCEKAAENMATVEEKAPVAVELMRRCNPYIEERIQASIAEIQENARRICELTRDFDEYEALGRDINKAAKCLYSEEITRTLGCISTIIRGLESLCGRLPEDKRELGCQYVKEIERASEFPDKIERIAYTLGFFSSAFLPLADVVILTVLPEEYAAVLDQLTPLRPPSTLRSATNLYAWEFGDVHCEMHGCAYKVTLGMIGRAGTTESALATSEAIRLWNPQYVLFIGVAGGMSDLNKGDVVISKMIHGYEYGKIDDGGFQPRDDWTHRPNLGIMNLANAYALRLDWRDRIRAAPPVEVAPDFAPRVVSGEVASGDKVVDNPDDAFFTRVLQRWPKIKAVEMEGAGAGSAIEKARDMGSSVGFMMIRGISDLPRPAAGDEAKETRGEKETRGTKERDDWKPYASGTAAAFAVGLIASGLPDPPVALDEPSHGVSNTNTPDQP